MRLTSRPANCDEKMAENGGAEAFRFSAMLGAAASGYPLTNHS
jgi:hypothetical protein